jgi:Protein of unknown function (DUF4058)
MSSVFPGMDPYLEYPAFWSSFHTRLMVAIAESLESQLGSQYYVEVESRTYQTDENETDLLIGIPDAIVFLRSGEAITPTVNVLNQTIEGSAVATQVRPERVMIPMQTEVTERYLEVREMKTDRVITVIELLSPKNKRQGEGREAYEKKRRAILRSETHLIEIDLLRGAKPMEVRGNHSEAIYRILISRRDHRPMADFYGISLQQSLPSFPVPLQGQEAEPIVMLQEIFNHVYDRSRYRSRIDYKQPLPPPKLSKSDRVWVEEWLTQSLR